MRKIWHVFAASRGTAGAYVDALLTASREANIPACAFVSRYYAYDTEGAKRYFFPITNLTEKRNALIYAIRGLELALGYFSVWIAAIVARPILNLHLVDRFFYVRALFCAAKLAGLRVYVTCHDVAAGNVRMTFPRRRLLLEADKLVVHSSAARRLLLEHLGHEVADRIVQYNFPFSSYDDILSAQKMEQAAEVLDGLLGVEGAAYFLFIGAVRPAKGIETLIEAWKTCACRQTHKLLIAGRWVDTARALKETAMQLDNCTVVDRRLTNEEFVHFIARSKFSVLPYYSYSHSSVLISCAKHGAAVILSDIDLFKEFLPHDDLTYSSRDANELAAVLDKASEMSDEDVQARGEVLRQAVARYDRDLVQGVADAYR